MARRLCALLFMWSARVCYVYRPFLDFFLFFVRSFICLCSVSLTMFTKTLLYVLYVPAVVSVCVSLTLSFSLYLSVSLSLSPPFFFLVLAIDSGLMSPSVKLLAVLYGAQRIYFLVACRHEMIHDCTVRAIITIIVDHSRALGEKLL